MTTQQASIFIIVNFIALAMLALQQRRAYWHLDAQDTARLQMMKAMHDAIITQDKQITQLQEACDDQRRAINTIGNAFVRLAKAARFTVELTKAEDGSIQEATFTTAEEQAAC